MELQRYFKGILRWWWLLLLSTAIATGASYYNSLQQVRIYQASTTLMVGQVIQEANPTSQDFFTIERLAQSYAQIGLRQPILQATIDSLGLETHWENLKGQVNIQQIEGTQLLEISVLDNSPERAKLIADEIAHQLVLQSPTSPENQERHERGRFVQDQLDDLEQRIQTTQTRMEELKVELVTALSARQIQELQAEITSLEGLISNWQTNYVELLSFLDGGDSPNYLTVIEPAQLPTVPIGPDMKLNILLAAAVGLGLALATAFLLEYIDDTVKSTDELSESLGLMILGSISKIKGKDYKDKLIAPKDPFSPTAEAFRRVRSNIQYMAVDQPIKSILITSPEASAGKSTIAANLAVAMAQANRTTIIVDTDLRRPVIHKFFNISNSEGLTDLLSSPALEINGELRETGIDNLRVITSGPLPPNPSELLGSQKMVHLLQRLEEMADVVIFDSPPTLVVTDASALANQVDGVILVTQAGHTRRGAAHQAIKGLLQVRAKILGGVLNGVFNKGLGDSYYYSYHPVNGKD
jgi:capsular exopolysaccharide synthesis family protein